jgi:hypothetical protein
MSNPYIEKIRQEAFIDELEKIAFRFPWQKKKKKKKKESWKTKFAASMSSQLTAHDIGTRIGIGFGKFVTRRGF